MFGFHKQSKYQPVASSPVLSSASKFSGEVEDESLGLSSESVVTRQRRETKYCLVTTLTALNLIIFVVSCSLFATWFYNTHILLNAGQRGHHTYSPVLNRFDLDAKPTKINGTLFPSRDGGSIARKLPNNASDEVWEEWELTRVLPVTAEEIRKMGKDPSTAAKLEDDIWGLGDDAYAATFDVYHQLHCLNTLRQIVYKSHYGDRYTGAHRQDDDHEIDLFHIHINHCVDILLQALQCSGNVNLITMHWVETQPYPFPDMSINRQCVDFEGLTKWRMDNTIDMVKYVAVMSKPDGVKQLRAPDQYYEYFQNETNPNHINGANPGEDFNL